MGCRGNILLGRAVGSKIILVPYMSYEEQGSLKGLKGYKKMLELVLQYFSS